jgi:hypothetical protein
MIIATQRVQEKLVRNLLFTFPDDIILADVPFDDDDEVMSNFSAIFF